MVHLGGGQQLILSIFLFLIVFYKWLSIFLGYQRYSGLPVIMIYLCECILASQLWSYLLAYKGGQAV